MSLFTGTLAAFAFFKKGKKKIAETKVIFSLWPQRMKRKQERILLFHKFKAESLSLFSFSLSFHPRANTLSPAFLFLHVIAASV